MTHEEFERTTVPELSAYLSERKMELTFKFDLWRIDLPRHYKSEGHKAAGHNTREVSESLTEALFKISRWV